MEVVARSLFIRLLDEAPATAHLSHAAWHAWIDDIDAFKKMLPRDRSVEGLCFSYAAGSKAVLDDKTANHSIVNLGRGHLPVCPDDSWAWHDFDIAPGPQFLRLRLIDAWWDGDRIGAVSMFHDSALLAGPEGLRRIFHEYHVTALIDPTDYSLLLIDIVPGMLPFLTCHDASTGTDRLIGQPVTALGRVVSREFAGTAGCTHLNEALKAFQDIPGLVRQLERYRLS